MGAVEAGVAEGEEVAGEAGGFGLVGPAVGEQAMSLHVLGEGDADDLAGAGEFEEGLVAAGDFEAASAGEVDDDVRSPEPEFDKQNEQGEGVTGGDRVGDVAVDEVAAVEDGGGGGGFLADGDVGEHPAVGVGEGAGDEVEAGEGDDGVAEAAEPVDEDAFGGAGHEALVCLGFGAGASGALLLEFG